MRNNPLLNVLRSQLAGKVEVQKDKFNTIDQMKEKEEDAKDETNTFDSNDNEVFKEGDFLI